MTKITISFFQNKRENLHLLFCNLSIAAVSSFHKIPSTLQCKRSLESWELAMLSLQEKS